MKRILLLADGRSPITLSWMSSILEGEWEIHLVSTYPCAQPEGVASLHVLPLFLNRLSGTASGNRPEASDSSPASPLRWIAGRFRSTLIRMRYYLSPLSVMRNAKAYQTLVEEIQPDVVHALRIPFEGMLASYTPPGVPVVVSSWGNDFTLHAAGSWLMGWMTRRCMRRANGLLADADRDLRLGVEWGLDPGKPRLFAPGSGGLNLEEMNRDPHPITDLVPENPAVTPLVINPRGIRPAYVRNDTFFAALPRVINQMPEVRFVCPSMQGQFEAEQWVRRGNLERYVYLLPNLPQERLWDLFSHCAVAVSPAIHDGTPNSLLEAMACGCFPVAGDLESLRQWITPGKNGLLIDPGDADALADAILSALGDPEFRHKAAKKNIELIGEKADVKKIRKNVRKFYASILEGGTQPESLEKA